MDLLDRLRQVGYTLTAEEGKIKCHWQGPGQPDPVEVQPLLEELRHHKAEAFEALRREQTRTAPDLLLSCRDQFVASDPALCLRVDPKGLYRSGNECSGSRHGYRTARDGLDR